MMFNTNTNGDPRSFFYYKDDFYINGTEIILKDSYINTHKWNGKKLWKYARYDHQTEYNGGIGYFFCASKTDWYSLYEMGIEKKSFTGYASFFVIMANELDSAIEEITKPIKLERAQTEVIKEALVTPKKEFDYPGMALLWIAYFIAMFASLVFKQFYLLWIIETVVFLNWRKGLMK